jgi:hypothetical protein
MKLVASPERAGHERKEPTEFGGNYPQMLFTYPFGSLTLEASHEPFILDGARQKQRREATRVPHPMAVAPLDSPELVSAHLHRSPFSLVCDEKRICKLKVCAVISTDLGFSMPICMFLKKIGRCFANFL